jgi:hypothetical protein
MQGLSLTTFQEILVFKSNGIDTYVECKLDYQVYDEMSLAEAVNLPVIFTDLESALAIEMTWYNRIRLNKLATIQPYYLGSENLRCIADDWDMNEKSIRADYKVLENDILSAINNLKWRVFSWENFDELLNNIHVDDSITPIEVSSRYSSIKAYAQTKDDLYVCITNYIEELIENGEISLIGKDVDDTADALYACAISEKYGENIFDCNEDEE